MEWISVKDRLPDDNEDVLVYNPKDGISTGCYEAKNVHWYIESDGSKFYTYYGMTKSEWIRKAIDEKLDRKRLAK